MFTSLPVLNLLYSFLNCSFINLLAFIFVTFLLHLFFYFIFYIKLLKFKVLIIQITNKNKQKTCRNTVWAIVKISSEAPEETCANRGTSEKLKFKISLQLKHKKDSVCEFDPNLSVGTAITSTDSSKQARAEVWQSSERLQECRIPCLHLKTRNAHGRQQSVLTDGTYSLACDRHTWQRSKGKNMPESILSWESLTIMRESVMRISSAMWGRQQ